MRLAAGEVHDVVCGLDPVDLGDPELDPVVDLRVTGPDDLARVGQPERNEQQAGLVDVAVVAVDHRDLGGVAVDPAQPVRGQRAAGAGAEDHDAMAHANDHRRTMPSALIRANPQTRCGQTAPSVQARLVGLADELVEPYARALVLGWCRARRGARSLSFAICDLFLSPLGCDACGCARRISRRRRTYCPGTR